MNKRKFIVLATLKIMAFIFIALGLISKVNAQNKYTFEKLSQEGVRKVADILPQGSKEIGDTSFTLFRGASVSFKTYFVNGPQYDNIFNPHPTGIIINGLYFKYFCDPEKAYSQNYNDFLEGSQVSFLGNQYIILINFREDCLASGCKYRCYNIFDISERENIQQISFSSVFQGLSTFGEFNNDGIIDFVRVAPKTPNSSSINDIPYYLVTSYTIIDSKLKQLNDSEGQSYYMYTKADPYEFYDFEILKHSWFFDLKDSAGQKVERTPYFTPYISFDPKYKHLYSPDGIRIEKHNWAILIRQMSDLDAARRYCRLIQNKNNNDDVYIMVDQYNGDIKFQVLSGNFVNRNLAIERKRVLANNSISGTLFDLKSGY